MCQIADMLGVTGITWWVVLLNAAIALAIIHRQRIRRVVPALVTTAIVILAVALYGAFRLSQNTTTPGPTVLVVQANYKQSNTGEKGASTDEIVAFHLRATRDAIAHARASGKKIDLVVWSETMLPAINTDARRAAHGTDAGDKWTDIVYQLGSLAQENQIHLLVGAIYFADWQARDEQLVPMDRRNSAYFFDTSGALTDTRYDKIHLVPFGEYIPFKHSISPLYRLFLKLGPNYYEEYVLTPGDKLVTFELGGGTRFVVPICFEDVVSEQVAAMFHGDAGAKRADFIVNITNDGWFRGAQMPQHLQAAIFRSIENRAPTARSVNTGISGFVDSVGRVSGTVPAGTEGTSVATLMLDRRVSVYTRVGDVFALVCVGATLGVAGWMFARHMRYKRDLQRGPRS
jgi:apolipoprotein N-acyltransferase